MTLVAFDTLKYASRLERSGFERKQATELAEAQSEVLSELMQERLVTKADLHEAKTELQGQIQEVRNELRDTKIELQGQIQEVRHELLGTKEELQGQTNEFRKDLQGQIHQLSLQMKEMQNTLLRWTGGLITGSVVILSFLLKALKLLS